MSQQTVDATAAKPSGTARIAALSICLCGLATLSILLSATFVVKLVVSLAL